MIRATQWQQGLADWLEEGGDYKAAAEFRDCPYAIGQEYYFRLATYAWIGRVIAVGPQEIVLADCSCVFESGELGVFQGGDHSNATVEAVEGHVVIGRGAVVDAIPYRPWEWITE